MREQDLSSEFERAGVWRRLAALLIDMLVIALVLQACALVLFPLTHGRVQFADGIYAIKCTKLDAVPAGVALPPDFNANVIIDCQNRVFGLLSARGLRVQRVTTNGSFTREIHIDSMLDADGVPVTGLSLGILMLPLLLAWRFALDNRQGTPGRRICRIRLARVADGGTPTARDMRRRYLLLLVILSPLIIWPLLLTFFRVTALPENVLIGITIASYGPAMVVALAALRQVYLRRDTWYDRFAATCVVRTEQLWVHHAAAPAFAAQAVGHGDGVGMPVPFGIDGSTGMPDGLISLATPQPLPRAPERLRQNYIARHWRGELSLPLSYWVNGIVLGAIAGVAIFTIAALVTEALDWRPGIALTLMCAIWLVVWLLAVWQTVGVWRSATHYRAGGSKPWGGVAKVAIVLGVASTLWQFCTAGLPQIAGVVDILTGDSAMGPHQFKVLASGEMLDFSGGIKFGVADELASLLDAMPDVKTVRLNSYGGRIREAQKMSDIVRARGLSTLVDKECLSACTIVFLGGRDRAILANARLGFHQPSYQGITEAGLQRAIAVEEERLQKLGLSRAFAERANQAKPTSMWFPTSRELVDAHVATRVVAAVGQPQPVPATDAKQPVRASADENESAQRAETSSAQPGPTVSIPQDLLQRLRSPQAAARPPSSITGIK